MLEWSTSPATVDWCEKNYQISEYLAEFNNCISMLPHFLLSIQGLYTLIQLPRNWFGKIAFAISLWISLGSFMFHATLNRFWQAHDELPMFYLSFFALLIIIKLLINLPKQILTFWLLYHFLTIYITNYYFKTSQYNQFLIPYSTLTITTLLLYLYHILYKSKNSQHKYLGSIGILLMIISFFFWNIDYHLCPNWLPGHSIWHIGIGFAQYYIITYTLLEIQTSPTLRLTHYYFIPLLQLKK